MVLLARCMNRIELTMFYVLSRNGYQNVSPTRPADSLPAELHLLSLLVLVIS